MSDNVSGASGTGGTDGAGEAGASSGAGGSDGTGANDASRGTDVASEAGGIELSADNPVRVTFVLSRPSGYMAACWRALDACPEVEVSVVVGRPTPSADNAPFSADVMAGINHTMVADGDDIGEVEAAVAPTTPEVLVLGGWQHQGISELAVHRDRLGAQSVVMAMDNPQRFTGHGWLVSARHRRYLRHVDSVWVPGERARRLAAEIQTRSGLVFTGLYAVDDRFADLRPEIETGAAASDPVVADPTASTATTATTVDDPVVADPTAADPTAGDWPRSFLFLGQYVPRKGLDVLLDAYRSYRSEVADPWTLTCGGTGELAPRLVDEPGVTDLGFVQPQDLPALVAAHGVMVVPSRVDPWPLVVVEGALGGRPLVVTDACGSAVEVVRDGFNGLVIPPASAPALTGAMRFLHHHREQLPTWGDRSAGLAAPYSASVWAQRCLVLLGRMRHSGSKSP